MLDTFANSRVVQALMPIDFVTDVEGLLIDVREYAGVAQAVVIAVEDVSQAITEKLDVGVHNVASDSVAPAAGNLIVQMTQIVATNTTSPVAVMRRSAVNIDNLTERYVQFNFAETNTYEGLVCAFLVMNGKRGSLPLNGTPDTGGGA